MPLSDVDWQILQQVGTHIINRAKELIKPGNHPNSSHEDQAKTSAAYDVNNNYGIAPGKIAVTLKQGGQHIRSFKVPGVVHKDADERAEEEELGIRRPRRQATVAIHFGAGNCDHYAAFSWAMLRDCLPSRYQVAMVSASHGITHRFTVVGLADDFTPQTPLDCIVAVDPWPEKAQVILLQDHFSCFPKATTLSQSGVEIIFSKKCKGAQLQLWNSFAATTMNFQIAHFMRTGGMEKMLAEHKDARYDADDPHARYYTHTSRK